MTTKILVSSIAVLGLAGCQSLKKNDYDTTDPYGVPDYGAESADYQAVNPPANPPASGAYGSPAYTETAPSLPPQPSGSAGGGPARSHTVVKGDSLWKLSRQYGVSVDAIKAANGMTGDTIRIGQTIKIPAH